MLLIDNRGIVSDDVDHQIANSIRLLTRAQALRWQAMGLCGSDRDALLAAAAVCERRAIGDAGAERAEAGEAAAGHAASGEM
jgi:hypothetical protein